jgi:hypothetical protein
MHKYHTSHSMKYTEPVPLWQWLLQVPGFTTFEAMVRIFRVVRVFRIFRLGKRLKNEVLSRLLTLVFTLVAVIVTAAGVFYEIETRFGVRQAQLRAARGTMST